jgi:hypothetical protein
MGSMGGTGAGLLAISLECNVLVGNNIRYIPVYPSVRSIVFRSPVLISPFVLSCTEEKYTHVLAMTREHALADTARNLIL